MKHLINEQMFFEIADVSKEKEEYIKYPVLQSIDYEKDDLEELLPLSSYYYEVLAICYDKFDVEQKNIINEYKQILFKMWVCCNEENYKDFFNYIKTSSGKIRKIVRADKKSQIMQDFGKLNEIIKNNEDHGNINYWYNRWQDGHLRIEEILKENNIYCVAIAYPSRVDLRDSKNSFYSLSGTSNDYLGITISNWGLKKNIEYDKVGELIQYIFGYPFTPCHLQDTTKRYTYYDSNKKFNRMNCNGTVLKKPINLKMDYKLRGTKANFKAHYSCCEKKIISQMNYTNLDYNVLKSGTKVINKLTSYTFRILIEPCRMCRPALIGCYNIYYFEWMKPHQVGLGKTSKEPLIMV